jgi:radical SAM protein with 4Fe4S-binding SPASM domain
MATEYDLEAKLSFPEFLYEKFIDEYHVIIAVDFPNWLILTDQEYRMFCTLRQGASIREALEKFCIEFCRDENECLAIMTRLLGQIHDVNFTAHAKTFPQETIKNIAKTVHIGTTNGCNMRCSHCYMAAGTSPLQTIDLHKVIKIVQGLNDAYGRLKVVVSGGEPLTYKDIYALLNKLQGNSVILFTNGTLINEENIDKIAEYCDEIQISLEGISQKAYEKIRGANNYAKVKNTIELLKSREKKIVLAITILPETIEDIRNNLVSFIEKIDYKNLEIRINNEIEMSGNALSMDFTGWSKDIAQATTVELIRKLRKMGYSFSNHDIRNTKFLNCGIGASVVINYDGKVYPCHKMSDYALSDNASVQEIITTFDSINDDTSNDKILKCQSCELRYICSGGCRIDNYLKTGSMTKVICDESFKDEKLRILINDFKAYRD